MIKALDGSIIILITADLVIIVLGMHGLLINLGECLIPLYLKLLCLALILLNLSLYVLLLLRLGGILHL